MLGALSALQRYTIAGLLVLIAINAGVSVYYYNLSDKRSQQIETAKQETETERERTRAARTETVLVRKELEGVRSELEAARESIRVREDELEKINKDKEQSDAKLQQALRGNRDWASGSVPDSVRNAFQDEGATTPAGSQRPANASPSGTPARLQNPSPGKARNK